jgi:hypothetical protein
METNLEAKLDRQGYLDSIEVYQIVRASVTLRCLANHKYSYGMWLKGLHICTRTESLTRI